MTIMSAINRRDLVFGLPGLFTVRADAVQARTAAEEVVLSAPRVFLHEQMPVKKNANGSETRSVTHGALVTGEAIEIHETMLAVGGEPNPPHKHRQSDMIFVREGVVAFEHDGKAEHVGAGGVIFVASETMHTLRNVGEVPARYFVVIVGRETKKKLV